MASPGLIRLFSEWDVAVATELSRLGLMSPYEGLPKEEHLRCVCYHVAAMDRELAIFVESPYTEVGLEDSGHPKTECDLWIGRGQDDPGTWIEIKRAWYFLGWPRTNNQPQNLLSSWKKDADKLVNADPGERAFLLFCFFDSAQGDRKAVYYDGLSDYLSHHGSEAPLVGSTRRFTWRGRSVDLQLRLWSWTKHP